MTKATKSATLNTVAKKAASPKVSAKKPATVRKPRTRKAKVTAPAPMLLLTGPKVRVAPVNVLPTDDTVIYLPGPTTAIKQTRGLAKTVVLNVPYLGESAKYFNSKDPATDKPIWFSRATTEVLSMSIDGQFATIVVPGKVARTRNLHHLAA